MLKKIVSSLIAVFSRHLAKLDLTSCYWPGWFRRFLPRRTSPEGQSFRSHTESWRKEEPSWTSERRDEPDEDYENVRHSGVMQTPSAVAFMNIFQVCFCGGGKWSNSVCVSQLNIVTKNCYFYFIKAWASVHGFTGVSLSLSPQLQLPDSVYIETTETCLVEKYVLHFQSPAAAFLPSGGKDFYPATLTDFFFSFWLNEAVSIKIRTHLNKLLCQGEIVEIWIFFLAM